MRSHTGKRSTWRRAVLGAVTSGALTLGLLMGVGTPTAHADILDDVYAEYATGAGGGQVSNLVRSSIKLRALGFRPTKSHLDEIENSLAYRPNQKRLVEALQDTIAYQRKRQAQAANAGVTEGPFTIGINQLPPGYQPDPTNPDNTGIFIAPGGSVQQPIGP